MRNKAVIGMAWGDEGKGHVVSSLISGLRDRIVVRFSGGPQAGHTVVNNGIRHVFSHFGSGTRKGVATYWSRFCPVDPIALINELTVLQKLKVEPLIFIDADCPIITPYDAWENQKDYNKRNGTCGIGVGTTMLREEMYYSLLFKDLWYPWIFQNKLEAIRNYYGINHIQIDRFNYACDVIKVISNIQIADQDILKDYKVKIFEGSQGLMLDQHYGIFPHVTRSNTGFTNILELTDEKFDVCFVTRAYQTRHGKGPMSTAEIPHNIAIDPHETNVTNEFQGEFRRGLLDVDLLRYAIMSAGDHPQIDDTTLYITCLDHIRNEYRFVKDGGIIYCNSLVDFIDKITSYFSFTDIYISDGPDDKYVKKWTKSRRK